MISSFLTSLYANCKVLVHSGKYDNQELDFFFKNTIRDILTENKLQSEIELIGFLTKNSHHELAFFLNKNPLIHIFYLVNSISELNNSGNQDNLGRFKYVGSIQEKHGVTVNTVLLLMLTSIKNYPILDKSFKIINHNSYFFLSHDIDSLYGSTLQDGLWALKTKQFNVLLKIFVNVLIARPHWFNIDLIMNLETEYDFKSTFYWIVNKGRVDRRQTNADYTINSTKLLKTLDKVEKAGFENGLHKSVSNDTFEQELSKLSKKVIGNRYHYLKFNLPQGYKDIEDSGLKLDASLGYAEQFGFRNNYGYPFSPFNFETGKSFSFTEVPLTIMDGTFQRYMNVPVNRTAEKVIGFFEINRQNCLLSILWHNTFFTNYKYKGYMDEYVLILKYLRDEKFININQSQIIEQFSWKQ